MRTGPRQSPWRLVATLALVAAALAGCGNEGDDGEGSGAETAGELSPTVPCTYTEGGGEGVREVEPPPPGATEGGTVAATVTTNSGDLAIDLARDTAPCTVGSFLSLAEQGYFDDTPCHRVTTEGILVLQCGDPSGTGTGGPGYQFDDELSGEESYPAGTVAMANAGPGTNGSQFFMVYADSPLPPEYTVFGTLDPASVRLVADIAEKGTSTGGPDGPPKEPVVIESVTTS